MEKSTYFLDFSYDEVIPLVARSDLVDRYEVLLKENDVDAIITRFDTKEDLLDMAVEQAGYARDGGRKFEMISDEEMQRMIDEVK